MRTRKEARAEREAMIARLRGPSAERAAEAAVEAIAARERIEAAGGIGALSPSAYRAERSAMLARLRAQ